MSLKVHVSVSELDIFLFLFRKNVLRMVQTQISFARFFLRVDFRFLLGSIKTYV